MQSEFGTESYKLVRTGDIDTSHEAADSIDTTRLEQIIYEYICSRGEAGCISDEVLANFPDIGYPSITPRYRALLDKDLVVDTGERRTAKSGRKQRVMVAKKFLGE